VARFSEQFIRQVAQAVDVVELVGRYVALKKQGKEFVGLCPFHEDHRPSLRVSPAKQIFKCFACGAGGGVFQFVMLYEKLAFPEAVRALAERANIPIPTESVMQPGDERLSKAELVKLTTFAARFYRSRLRSPEGVAALEYAHSRGLSDESIDRFGLGWAPSSWEALTNAARRDGFSDAQLLGAGLTAKREGGSGIYDRFRNRLMFPIIDPAGRVVAFGGRALDEAEHAKYLNSPESVLFDKSGLLYAINWSREAIVSTGRAVIVEGYLDALIPLQAGVNNVAATLGTALTDRHVRLLSRYAREMVLVFDADIAGAAAAERAMEIFLAQQLSVRVATIPAGKDPCDYCLAEGPDALTRLIDEAPDALEYVWQRHSDAMRRAGDNLADRRRLVEDFLRLVVWSSAYGAIDEVRRGQLAQHIGHMLNVAPGDLQQQMRRLVRRRPRRSGGTGPGDDAAPAALAERQLLEVLLNRPELFDQAGERVAPEDFDAAQLREVAQCVWELGGAGRLCLDELLAKEEMSSFGPLLATLATAGERRGNYEQTLTGAVEHLLYRRDRLRMQEMKSEPLDDRMLRTLDKRLKSPDLRRHPKIS